MLVVIIDNQIIAPHQVCQACLLADRDGPVQFGDLPLYGQNLLRLDRIRAILLGQHLGALSSGIGGGVQRDKGRGKIIGGGLHLLGG